MPEYSFVVPVYNESEVIAKFYSELSRVLNKIGDTCEVLFATGGNTDNTLEILKNMANHDKRIKVINMSHRFDYQAALTAGLDHASGDAVITLDGDLQHPPSLIPTLIDNWKKGYDIVYTVREETKNENIFKKAGSRLFYFILKLLTRVDFEENCADFRLLSRKAVEAFKKFPETQRYIPGIVHLLGFKRVGVRYVSDTRQAGRTKFTFSRLLSLAVNGILSFSIAPIRFIVVSGFIMTILSFIYLVIVITWRIIHPDIPAGWASILSAVLLLSSFNIFALGIIGEYVARIYEEAKRRPLYLIDELIGFDKK